MKVAVIGSGVFGYAIAQNLYNNKHKVTIITSSKEKEKELINGKQIIEGYNIPKDMEITSDYSVIKDINIVFLMTSAKYLESTLESIRPYVTSNHYFCIGSKGILNGEKYFMSEVFKSKKVSNNYSIISGPSFAIDLVAGEPIAFALAASNSKTDRKIKEVLSSNSIKIRSSNDMIGIQLCGSIKNVVAIAAGIISGLGYHESTRSFLLVESMHDIKNLSFALRGKKKTILSFAGIGDLILTCTSEKSRNYSYGLLLGQKKFDEANEYVKNTTVEGYYTLKSIYDMLNKKKIKMPIIDLIYNIVINGKEPETLINFLINKE